MTTKNPIKLIKNPNSPEAIHARLNNLPDPTIPDKIHLITDNKAGRIFIDLTETGIDQRVGYIITGGPHSSRKYVRSVFATDKQGRHTMTSYYVDTHSQQWVIIKDFYTRPIPVQPDYDATGHFPFSTYGSFSAPFGASAPGENWRNERRSADSIKAARYRSQQHVKRDPKAEHLEIHEPEDQFQHDFNGQK